MSAFTGPSCIYSLGHRRLAVEGRLIAALLFAGPGSTLSHDTASWWFELMSGQPSGIHVSSAGRQRSIPGVHIHHPRDLHSVRHRGMPVTPVAQTLLDFAATATHHQLRRALANADYRGLLDARAIEAICGRGRRGSRKLRAALDEHLPQLAFTRSELEERFLALCEAYGIPSPETNVMVEGWLVDALWRERRVIVELDGHRAHRSAAQLERDHERDMCLRAVRHEVRRYAWGQVTQKPELVARDLDEALRLNPTARSAARGSR